MRSARLLRPRSVPAIARELTGFVAQLVRARRGNVLIITGLALFPMTFLTGMAIDYSQAARLQTKANAAADAAALSGTAKPMLDRSFTEACNAARHTFLHALELNNGGLSIRRGDNPTVVITETYRSSPPLTYTCPKFTLSLPATFNLPQTRTVTVSYSADSTNSFSGILGSDTIAIGGSAVARSTASDFIDIHMALDTSQSMGLAATDADAVKLWNATTTLNGRGCQFGCHSRDPNEKYSMEEIARMPSVNARMRIDVLRDATIEMIKTAMDNQGSERKYRFALYRIGKNAGRWGAGADEYYKLTDDLASVRTKVSTLSLSANDGAVGFGDTDLPYTLSMVRPLVKATSKTVDNGDTRAKARKFFFLVTDGVSDVEGPCAYSWNHCTSPINAVDCNAYKLQDITVGVVYTSYLPVKANPLNPGDPTLREEYIRMVQPIAGQIKPRLEQCATPGWFFEASDGPSIHAAMQKLFKQASESSRLTR